MKISYNWLKQFIKIDLPVEETSEILTDLGLEVEGVEAFESVKGSLKGIVVGHVLECIQHPNADRLRITKVNIGTETVQIVCGAPNVAQGQKVPVATIGTTLYDENGEAWKIKKGKIRGEESHGMICAEDELGLGQSHDGIMVLDETLEPGTPVAKLFDIESDHVFEIGLTPNRADAMSHYGVARDLKAGLIQKNKDKNEHYELISPSVSSFHVENRTLKVDVEVEESELAARYCGVTIANVEIKESPEWIKNRLKAIGLTPKNNVVDITNYVMHELGQPLHAFDANKIVGNKIVVRKAKAEEKFITLDEVERTLHEDDLMICDAEKPLCIAGVFGGVNSGVEKHTTNVFLESAYFNPVSVRKTAKRHGLNTDASFRFERGIDVNFTKYALLRAALLIKQEAGGQIASEVVDFYPKKFEDFQVFLTFEKVNKLIGQDISKETIKSILSSLEIKVNNVTESGIGLTIPSYRVDVQREADVIEEILRVYGYNNIEFGTKINASIANSTRFEDYKLQNIVSNQLVAQGFNEMMANSLTTANYTSLSESLNEAYNVNILNPLSGDLGVMRQSLLFSALEALSYNLNRRRSDLKLFEFGKTYHKYTDSYTEEKHLTLTVTGNITGESWTSTTQKADFFYFKGAVESVLQRLGIANFKFKPVKSDIFSEGIGIYVGKMLLVEFGVVKHKILKHFDIKQEVLFADYNWEKVIQLITKKVSFTELPKYPEVKRDLALLLDNQVSFDDVYQTATQSEKALLKNINLFDVYQGDKLPEGKKSYAVSFTLQNESQTLTDKQIDKVMQKLTDNFEKQLGATLR